MISTSFPSEKMSDDKIFDSRTLNLFNAGLALHYQSSTDVDGVVKGHTTITTNTDVNGNSYSFTNIYDANWNLTESTYIDGSGNVSRTQYQYSNDVDGVIKGYNTITTNTDANGNSYSFTNIYDANWNLTESTYIDGSDNVSRTQYQYNNDVDGVVIVCNFNDISLIVYESDYIKETYAFSSVSDYLPENSVASVTNVDLVGITDVIYTDIFII
jgi:hypothetical protein